MASTAVPNGDLTFLAQWSALRAWIGALTADELDRPSTLDGWSVADLVAHLSGTCNSIAALRPAPQTSEPLTVAGYLAGYSDNASQIADRARQIARSTVGDLTGTLDAAHQQAARTLTALGDREQVVQSLRGPINLGTFLDTRLIELVVHAGDLQASLPDRNPPPVLPAARQRAVSALRDALTERAADPVAAIAAASALDPDEFIRAATGRVPVPDAAAGALGDLLPLF